MDVVGTTIEKVIKARARTPVQKVFRQEKAKASRRQKMVSQARRENPSLTQKARAVGSPAAATKEKVADLMSHATSAASMVTMHVTWCQTGSR